MQARVRSVVIRAERRHDLGKAHAVFWPTTHACEQAPEGLLAKSPCRSHHRLRLLYHQPASTLTWRDQHDHERDADLIAYLIAAHHGKVRMNLRAMPAEAADKGATRFCSRRTGSDVRPELDFDGEPSGETTLRLALMEFGEGEQGPSWTERSRELLEDLGPARLASLKTLVRLADWRASAAEQPQTATLHGAPPDPVQLLAMSLQETIRQWRALPPEEQRRRRLARIPQKVARSMAFEGEPVPPGWLETQQRLSTPPDTSTPASGS